MTVKEVLDQFRYTHGAAYTLSCYIERGPGMTYEGPIPEDGGDMASYTVYEYNTLVYPGEYSAMIIIHC